MISSFRKQVVPLLLLLAVVSISNGQSFSDELEWTFECGPVGQPSKAILTQKVITVPENTTADLQANVDFGPSTSGTTVADEPVQSGETYTYEVMYTYTEPGVFVYDMKATVSYTAPNGVGGSLGPSEKKGNTLIQPLACVSDYKTSVPSMAPSFSASPTTTATPTVTALPTPSPTPPSDATVATKNNALLVAITLMAFVAGSIL